MIKTLPDQFEKFHKRLMSNAPIGYEPWYFPVKANDKAPDPYAIIKRSPKGVTNPGSWLAPWARLSFEEAHDRLKQGANVGISGRKDDELIIIDIDDSDYTKFAPNTLMVRSRKRIGVHAFCWRHPECNILPLNIPTDYGEMRSSDQYVVACGSYVTTEGDNSKIDFLGNYTLEKDKKPIDIKYREIPEFLRKQKEKADKKPKALKKGNLKRSIKGSAFFRLTINDIVTNKIGSRDPHPLHESDTGSNFSIDNNGLAHCWRHLVSLNAYQFMVVKSGYMSCLEAGTGHKGGGAGPSDAKNDLGALFHAWRQAKEDRLIPEDDPIPLNAMKYIAWKHNLMPERDIYKPMLPYVYNQVIKILREEY